MSMPMDCGSHDARVSYASEEKSLVACIIIYISGCQWMYLYMTDRGCKTMVE